MHSKIGAQLGSLSGRAYPQSKPAAHSSQWLQDSGSNQVHMKQHGKQAVQLKQYQRTKRSEFQTIHKLLLKSEINRLQAEAEQQLRSAQATAQTTMRERQQTIKEMCEQRECELKVEIIEMQRLIADFGQSSSEQQVRYRKWLAVDPRKQSIGSIFCDPDDA